jgi:hypothetical protein
MAQHVVQVPHSGRILNSGEREHSSFAVSNLRVMQKPEETVRESSILEITYLNDDGVFKFVDAGRSRWVTALDDEPCKEEQSKAFKC